MSFECVRSCFHEVVKSKYVFAERTREKLNGVMCIGNVPSGEKFSKSVFLHFCVKLDLGGEKLY